MPENKEVKKDPEHVSPNINSFFHSPLNLSSEVNNKNGDEWKRWWQQFEIFMLASGLDVASEKRKVAVMLHSMGRKGLDIFNSFNIKLDNASINILKEKSDRYFEPRKNLTMTRYSFFTRKQSIESVDEFLTDLENLSMNCDFGDLRESLVRDIFIANMAGNLTHVKQRLLQETDLSLTKAAEIAKTVISAQQNAEILTKENNENIFRLQHTKNSSHMNKSSQVKPPSSQTCGRCGLLHRFKCPAAGSRCNICQAIGHFARCCFKNKNVRRLESQSQEQHHDDSLVNHFFIGNLESNHSDLPKFAEPISNVTIPVGREATLICVVDDLASYKVAWLRVDTQTILTIHSHVITKNHRIGVSHSDHRTWYLHIRELRPSDRGWYMCQINTDPMKSQVGFLDVVVPPDILDNETSTDMVVRENSAVQFRCAASGSPQPSITWRRESGEKIQTSQGEEVGSIEGPSLNITKVNRLHMGAYLCIASNGVPPSVSKRVSLIVHFPPMVWIQNQLVGAVEGDEITLECHSEAYPKSINYWTREKGDIIAHGAKYEPVLVDNAYKVHMKLTIREVGEEDFGSYKCVAKNSLGDTDGTIKLYSITPSTNRPKYKEKGKHRKYGPNDIDPGLSAKQRELKQGRYNEVESSSPASSSNLLPIVLVLSSYPSFVRYLLPC